VLALLLLIGVAAVLIGRQGWAEYQHRAALADLEAGELEQARAHLDACLRVRTSSADVHFLLARTTRRLGDYAAAEHHLQECERLGGIAEAIALERQLLRAQLGEPAHESYLLDCAEKGHPDSAVILEALARGYLRTFQITRAEYCLERWLKLEPNNVQALLLLGETKEHLRNNAEALAAYSQAVEQAPRRADARLRLARRLALARRPAEALEHYQFLSELEPDNAEYSVGRAHCLRELGRADEARPVIDAVLARHPHNTQALAERGHLALQKGDLDTAERSLQEALAGEPAERELLFALSRCYEQKGDTKQADEVRERLKRIDDDLVRVRELTRKIAESPHDADLRSEIGRIFLDNRQDREGLRWLASALHENARHIPTHRALAEFYERTGQPELAERSRRLAAEAARGVAP
jgi:tetratricopeptide (TPR) repeat protein